MGNSHMRLLHYSILIARPREAVFDFFSDFSQSPRWRSYVRSTEVVGGGPPRAGSRIRVQMELMGEPYSYDLIVLQCERPSRWRHRSEESDFDGYVEYTFEPEGNGTRVTMSMVAKPKNLHGWLAMPVMWLSRNKSYRDQLPSLKRALEE
jgi:uncharacterized protein YndB with AHSA1/START domain